MIAPRSRCILSTCPLLLGLYPVVSVTWIPSVFPKLRKIWLVNWGPRSEWMFSGYLYRTKISLSSALATSSVVVAVMGMASTHLVKASRTVRMLEAPPN